MADLRNTRQERFARALALGQTKGAAYATAGYAPNDSNCCRLANSAAIVARVAELMQSPVPPVAPEPPAPAPGPGVSRLMISTELRDAVAAHAGPLGVSVHDYAAAAIRARLDDDRRQVAHMRLVAAESAETRQPRGAS